MKGPLAALLLCLACPATGLAQGSPVIDLRGGRAGDQTFESVWQAAQRAAKSGDTQRRVELLQMLRRLRVERNVEGLESIALAAVEGGLSALGRGEVDQAQESFALAVDLDPHLPEGHLGLALAKFRRGPVHYFGALADVLAGLTARLPTEDGRAHAFVLLGVVLLFTGFAASFVFGVCMILRYGVLLRHDIEETLGSESRRPLALGLYAIALLLPVIAFQGIGWLPLWWLALLFLYLRGTERVITLAALAGLVLIGPVLGEAQQRLAAWRNPVFRAALVAVEGSGDERATAPLERARLDYPDDRDMAYLLAEQYKKAGRYESATAVWKQILAEDPKDGLALNNLANLEFAAADYRAAIGRYGAGLAVADAPNVRATLFYNLHLAHLQKFEYEQAQAARSQADHADRSLTQEYETRWRVERDGSAIPGVVDLGLSVPDCIAKFAGTAQGVRLKNVALKDPPVLNAFVLVRGLLSRFGAAAALFVLLILLRGALRGAKVFTLRCLKCGTPFCHKCHLGGAVAGLCTQCYHLFVVRDGVSGPARNQKLLEVQGEDERRERLFRILSLVSPGAGHIYGQRTIIGLLLVLSWYFLIFATVLAGRLLPVSEAPSRMAGPWAVVAAVLLLLVVYIVANRAHLDLDVVLPARRGGPRPRGR